MVFHNLPFTIESIQIDNVDIKIKNNLNYGENSQTITIDKEFNELHLFGK